MTTERPRPNAPVTGKIIIDPSTGGLALIDYEEAPYEPDWTVWNVETGEVREVQHDE